MTTTKRTLVKFIKAHKVLASTIVMITGLAGVWGIYKQISRKDISGKWHITFINQKSSYRPYIGETHVQSIYFTQKEESVTGGGEKTIYNGKPLPSAMHRLLEYIVDGDLLKANYLLHGLKRATNGMIEVTISSDGKSLAGKFSGDAGQTSGTVEGVKVD
jgi:hypothetical protein